MVDWIGAVLAILKAVRKEDQKIDPKYIVIKPRILSDENILRGVAAIRAVVSFIPSAAIAAPILSLGEVGFKIWKRIALSKDWDELVFPPLDPNVMRISMELDPVLSQHFGHLLQKQNWDERAVAELAPVYNDFSFITNVELLHSKYPEIDTNYIIARAARNRDILQDNISIVEQELLKVEQKAEIDTNVREAIEAVKTLVPAMRDWALFNSEGFDEILDIIDTVI